DDAGRPGAGRHAGRRPGLRIQRAARRSRFVCAYGLSGHAPSSARPWRDHRMMSRARVSAFALIACGVLAAPAYAQDSAELEARLTAEAQRVGAQWGLLETYCVECHNFEEWAGGVAFDTMTPDGVADEAKLWE